MAFALSYLLNEQIDGHIGGVLLHGVAGRRRLPVRQRAGVVDVLYRVGVDVETGCARVSLATALIGSGDVSIGSTGALGLRAEGGRGWERGRCSVVRRPSKGKVTTSECGLGLIVNGQCTIRAAPGKGACWSFGLLYWATTTRNSRGRTEGKAHRYPPASMRSTMVTTKEKVLGKLAEAQLPTGTVKPPSTTLAVPLCPAPSPRPQPRRLFGLLIFEWRFPP